MKYLFIETFPVSPHLETSLEIACDLKKKGNDVTFFWCGYDLPWTDWDLPLYKKIFLFSYKSKLDQMNIFLKNKSISILDKINLEDEIYKEINCEKNKIKFFSNLKNITYKDSIPLGISVYSSLKSKFRDKIKLIESKMSKAFEASCLVYERSNKAIKLIQPHTVVTFNYRFAITRPIIEAVKKNKIRFISHERGSSLDKYQMFNSNLFDSKYYEKKVNSFWKSKRNFIKKKKTVYRYFNSIEKKNFYKKLGFNYEKKLINNIKLSSFKKNYLFICTSDYEHQAIANDIKKFYINKKWSDQFEAIKTIVNIIKKKNDSVLYIKSHPNFDNTTELHNKILNISRDNIVYLPPNKKIDTLHLINNCNLVFSFGSSLELYSLYKKKRVISFFKAWWSRFNFILYPKNSQDLKNLINYSEQNIQMKNTKNYNLLKVCFFIASNGIKYKLFKPLGHSRGFFYCKKFNHYGPIINFFNPIFQFLKKIS